MAAPIKKTPAGKSKITAQKNELKRTTSKKAVKAGIEVKTKTKKTKATIAAKAMPSKGITVPQKKAPDQKPENKKIITEKSATTRKSSTTETPAADRFRGLKGMLIAKRDALLKEAKQEIVKYISGENRQLVDTAIDEADWAAVEISEDLNLKRLSAQRQLLKDVEECLRKLNEGTYGICEDCAEEISEKRLRVIPTATLCIDCKEQREKMAILEQDTEI